MPIFSPRFNKLADVATRYANGQASAQELATVLETANTYFQEGYQLYERILPSLLRTPAMDAVLNDCRRDLHDQAAAVVRMSESLSQGSRDGVRQAIRDLQLISTSIAEDYARLTTEETKEKIYSPFSMIDCFIKTGMNVLEGNARGQDLANRFPPVVEMVERMRRDIERFVALYDPSPTSDLVQKLVPNLNAALGACMEFFKTGSKTALGDGLKLLGRATTAIHHGLVEMDRIANAQRHCKRAFIDELDRTMQLYISSKFPWQHVLDTWSLVTTAWNNYRSELAAFKRFPLSPFLSAEENKVRQTLDRLGNLVNAVGASLRLKIPANTAALGPAFDEVDAAFASLRDGLDREMNRYKDAPYFQDLRERVGRVLLGEPPELMLREPLLAFQQSQAELLNHFDASEMPPEVAAKLTQAIAMQEQATAYMLEALDKDDKDLLEQGWKMLETAIPPLLDIARQMREAIDTFREPAPEGKMCIRCGAQNSPEARFCVSCNAVLLTTQVTSTEYTDIMTGEKESVLQAPEKTRVGLLEAMLRQMCEGQIAPEEVCHELEALAAIIQAMCDKFNQEHAMQLGPEHAEYLQYFNDQLSRYQEGLKWIEACIQNQDYEELNQGLDVCYDAENNLSELQVQVKNLLSGN